MKSSRLSDPGTGQLSADVEAFLHEGNECRHHEFGFESDAIVQGLTVAICTYKRAQSLNRFLDSLAEQEIKPDRLVIVDASPDEETEATVRDYPRRNSLAKCLLYFRVTGSLRGLTRQRNFALRSVCTDAVVFFDDDICLLPNCLYEMNKAYRHPGETIVGVGAFDVIQNQRPTLIWRLRLFLRIVTNLNPGSYHASGFSTPWNFLEPSDALEEGQWLPGCAMLWNTRVARDAGFNEYLGGYGQGEDLEFATRVRAKGRLVLAGAARVQHFHLKQGKPDHFTLGYMALYNRYLIHKCAIPERSWPSVVWFIYAWLVDSILVLRDLPIPGKSIPTVKHTMGRIKAACDLIAGREP